MTVQALPPSCTHCITLLSAFPVLSVCWGILLHLSSLNVKVNGMPTFQLQTMLCHHSAEWILVKRVGPMA